MDPLFQDPIDERSLHQSMNYRHSEPCCVCVCCASDEPDDSGGGGGNLHLTIANVFYVVWLGIFGVLGFVLYNTGGVVLKSVIKTQYTEKYAVGVACVARTTTPLAIWFAIHAVICICNSNLVDSIQYIIHTRFLVLHAIVLLGMWVGFWFVPDPFYDFVMKAAIYISALYELLQIIILLEFFHKLNEEWTKDVDENHQCRTGWKPIGISFTLVLAAVAALGVSYYIFVSDGCDANTAIITVNLVLALVLFVASLFVEHASILTASLVAVYVAFLTISGLICQSACNRIATGKQGIGFSIAASIFTIIWACYSAFSSGDQFGAFRMTPKRDGESEGEDLFSLSFFHTLMALAAIYVTMIVTHWGQAAGDNPPSGVTSRGNVGKWINFAVAWILMILYAWTLVAPFILKNRDWT
jgi:hypothetical protein